MIEDSFAGFGFGVGTSKCMRCGRTLSDPKSREVGMGPICLSRKQAETGSERRIRDVFLSEPHLRERIVMYRQRGIVYTNVPHAVTHHSPSGYEYGYGGSGPADLALNIMEIAVSHLIPDANHSAIRTYDGRTISQEAWQFHHAFKWQYIATMPREGGEIPWSEVENFVVNKVAAQREVEPEEGRLI